MPYHECPSCKVTSYLATAYVQAPVCPECGRPEPRLLRRPQITSREICEQVGRALAAVLAASAQAIHVAATEDGHVCLAGSVRSLTDHLRALEAARAAPGVQVVEDSLTILL